MKVSQALDLLRVKPNCVYVIPPNKSMTLQNGTLHLFDPVESRGLRLPIDVFFRSLAGDKLEKSIGIILSGMGSDGSLGIKAIKEKNGIVLVQEPASARFDSMPLNATEAVIADIVAPAWELPSKLLAFLKFIPSVKPEVIKTLASVKAETSTNDGRWFYVRIMPYRRLDDRIDGVVMTYTDISLARKLEIKLKEANPDFRRDEI